MSTTVNALGTAVVDLPLLKFGMIGFDSNQRQQIIVAAQVMPQPTVVWRAGDFSSADCWLVCGEKTRPTQVTADTQNTTLRVLAGLPSEPEQTLALPDIDRPLAFSVPLPNVDITPRLVFDLASPQSVHGVLVQFQDCLRQKLARFVLGKQLISREASLQAAVYHVMHSGKLLAIFDFTAWRMAFAPTANWQDLEHAMWQKRPVEARAIPNHFLPTDIAQLRWTYAQLTTKDVLPARYKNALIYFRQSPCVPLSWLSDSQLLVIHELSTQPADFRDLVNRSGLAPEQLNRDLASLYFAGSVTTDADKAALANPDSRTSEHADTGGFSKNFRDAFRSSLSAEERAQRNNAQTVSAQLR